MAGHGIQELERTVEAESRSAVRRASDVAIRFRANPRKALEVILWFANKRRGIDFHSILKLLFFADVVHLNEYGRPIVGDDYNALPYGPVAQTTYDILKCEPLAVEELGLDEMPFTIAGRYRVHPKREPDLRKLSESDVEALQTAWDRYAHLSFNARTDQSHEHPAYRNADGQRMRYEDFLEGENQNPEIISDLAEIAWNMKL